MRNTRVIKTHLISLSLTLSETTYKSVSAYSLHLCVCVRVWVCEHEYCISACHPSCGKATVGNIQCVWPQLLIQSSLAINHLLSTGCLHGKRPPDFTSYQDVHFGTQTSTRLCTRTKHACRKTRMHTHTQTQTHTCAQAKYTFLPHEVNVI